DDEFKLSRLLDGQVGGPGPLEDLGYERCSSPPDFTDVRPVGDQAACLNIASKHIHGGETASRGKLHDLSGLSEGDWGCEIEDSTGMRVHCYFEGPFDPLGVSHLEPQQPPSPRLGNGLGRSQVLRAGSGRVRPEGCHWRSGGDEFLEQLELLAG